MQVDYNIPYPLKSTEEFMPEAKKKPAGPAKKNKKKTGKKGFRGFLRKIWGLLRKSYNFAADTQEHEMKLKPRLFGRTVTFAGFMIMMVIFIVLITVVLNNRAVGVDHEKIIVTGLAPDFEGYRILVISDLNARTFGEKQSTLMRKLESEKYDCILFLGDMVGPSGNAEPFYDLIRQLNPKKNKKMYFIAGDTDPSPLVEKPREIDEENPLTLKQMVLSDWVLGAEELGAVYVSSPLKVIKNDSVMWLVPDQFLNLNVTQGMDQFKDELAQESDSYNAGVLVSRDTLPLTNYRFNQLSKTADLIRTVTENDLILMLSHEVPSDSQLNVAQQPMTDEQKKNYFPSPDLVLSGHYCGGEWKMPILGTLYVNSNILPRYGWFPDESYVQGQRGVGSIMVYTTTGLSNNSATALFGRLNNPPRVSIITLTGELPETY